MKATTEYSPAGAKGLIFFEDDGHGWLRVSSSELLFSGVAGAISPYSYIERTDSGEEWVYLEEDQDMTLFMSRVPGEVRERITRVRERGQSRIRRLRHFPSAPGWDERARLMLAVIYTNLSMIHALEGSA